MQRLKINPSLRKFHKRLSNMSLFLFQNFASRLRWLRSSRTRTQPLGKRNKRSLQRSRCYVVLVASRSRILQNGGWRSGVFECERTAHVPDWWEWAPYWKSQGGYKIYISGLGLAFTWKLAYSDSQDLCVLSDFRLSVCEKYIFPIMRRPSWIMVKITSLTGSQSK